MHNTNKHCQMNKIGLYTELDNDLFTELDIDSCYEFFSLLKLFNDFSYEIGIKPNFGINKSISLFGNSKIKSSSIFVNFFMEKISHHVVHPNDKTCIKIVKDAKFANFIKMMLQCDLQNCKLKILIRRNYINFIIFNKKLTTDNEIFNFKQKINHLAYFTLCDIMMDATIKLTNEKLYDLCNLIEDNLVKINMFANETQKQIKFTLLDDYLKKTTKSITYNDNFSTYKSLAKFKITTKFDHLLIRELLKKHTDMTLFFSFNGLLAFQFNGLSYVGNLFNGKIPIFDVIASDESSTISNEPIKIVLTLSVHYNSAKMFDNIF